MPEPYGSFGWICRHAPLPQCNLLFAQLWGNGSSNSLKTLFPATSHFFSSYNINSTSTTHDINANLAKSHAGTGVGMSCVVPRVGEGVGDIVAVIMLFISLLLSAGLITHAMRRCAALGRKEVSLLIGGYALLSALGAVTTTSMLEQASTQLTVLSAIHCALLSAVPWFLVVNAVVCADLMEDGTSLSIFGSFGAACATFGVTLYVALATALDTHDVFRFADDAVVANLRSDALFTLTFVWPAFAIVIYICTMGFVILKVVDGETRPLAFLCTAALTFAAGQLVLFLASQPICETTRGRVNGAFLTAILNNGALLALYAMWLFLTEDEWDDIRWSQTDMAPMPMSAGYPP